jgi:hypothetical protein
MMKRATAIALLASATIACVPDDRCGDDYLWDAEAGLCLAVDTDTETDTGPGPDGGDTDQDTGIGEVCTPTGDECADLEADYCASQPGAEEGYCTFEDCAEDTSICPAPYQCCDMGSLSFCASESDYSAMVGLGMCQE